MTQLHGPWRLLALAPTEDQRAIRRAYAVKLKAIDVERDPQAFIALREAFEHAQQIARWMTIEREEDENPEFDEVDHVETLAIADTIGTLRVDLSEAPSPDLADASPSPGRDGPWSPPTPEKFDAHAAALARLLQRNNEQPRPWPTDAEREEMLEHWRVLVADPRLHQLDFYADIERWLAGLIGYTIPFSDTLIVPVTEFFGWVREEGSITQSQGLAEVVYRYRMLSFLDGIRTPGNVHYEAWCELTTPADERSARGRVSVKKIHKLLHEVRVSYPGLEGNFEPERVALWDRRGTMDITAPVVLDEAPPKRDYSFLFWILLVLCAIPAIGSLIKHNDPGASWPDASRVTAEVQLEDEQRDIAMLLKTVGDGSLTLETLQSHDPKLAQLIRSNWQIAHDDHQPLTTFLNNVRKVLVERASERRRTASVETMVAEHVLVLEKARAFRRIAPQKCADFFEGKPWDADALPKELLKRDDAMTVRLLLEPDTDAPPRKGPQTFTMPHSVFEDARSRAKLSVKRMQDAAMHQGSPADICDGRIGLIEATIAMPAGAERTKLLRSL
jgi:hypothetical protein